MLIGIGFDLLPEEKKYFNGIVKKYNSYEFLISLVRY
jgi:hypothetical protein